MTSTLQDNPKGTELLSLEEELSQLKLKNEMLILENENLKAGLTNIQEHLDKSVSSNNTSLEESASINSTLEKLVDDALSIHNNVGEVSVEARNSRAKLSQLVDDQSIIQDLVKHILAIAKESKVLALNARIEAARAGEAGKGFSTVANEVQQLSDKTREASESIGSAIERIAASTGEVESAMTSTLDRSESVHEAMSTFYQDLEKTIRANRSSISHISETNDQIFMSLAKLDHILWKVNTYLSVLYWNETLKFVDHHHCRLGKWYYEGDGKKHFAHLRLYRDLEEPHAMTHEGTKEVLDQINAGDKELSTILDGIKKMEKGSEGVFDGLDAILREKYPS